MKLLRKITAVLTALVLVISAVPYISVVHAENASFMSPGAAEAGRKTVTGPLLNAGTGNVSIAGKTRLDPNALVAAMLSKAGKGYSQADRYSANYYDCSSLVQRCLSELGVNANVPASTYYWYDLLDKCAVGDVMTFYGPNTYIQYRLTAKNIPVIGNEAYVSKPGTIMVLIAPQLYSGHICVSLGEFARQDSGLDPAADRDTIIANTENYVASRLEATYGVPASLLTGPGSVTGIRSIWMDDTQLGTDMTNKYGEQSGTYSRIWRVEAYNTSKGVCVDNCVHGTNQTLNLRYVLEPVDVGSEVFAGPEITDISVSDETPDGFRVTAKFTAQAGVREILMPTWTEANGQDDLVWHSAGLLDENTASLYISTADHGNETGQYITHVYVTDNMGRTVVGATDAMVPASYGPDEPDEPENFEFIWTEVTEVSSDGYLVVAAFDSPNGVSQILMPTWTDANGQDDLIWYTAEPADDHTVYFYVSTADHNNEYGAYTTHIYVYDQYGEVIIAGVNADVPAPGVSPEPPDEGELEITDVALGWLTPEGYLLVAEFNAPNGVSQVLMPTWTEANGQDDLIWYEAEIEDNLAAVFVETADHNGEYGKYITHIYVYDNAGDAVAVGVEIEVPEPEPETPVQPEELAITDAVITELSPDGFRVTATFTAPNGVAEVLMPTWTEANGQDDLIWHKAAVNGNTATYYVRTADHKNESGLYITHIYVTDRTGAQVIAGTGAEVPSASQPEPVEPEPEVPEDPYPTPAGVYLANGMDYAPVFNPEYYLTKYPDLRNAFGTNDRLAFNHFVQYGVNEGRQASAKFSASAYRERYEDLQNAFGNDLSLYIWHYLTYGIHENRIGY